MAMIFFRKISVLEPNLEEHKLHVHLRIVTTAPHKRQRRRGRRERVPCNIEAAVDGNRERFSKSKQVAAMFHCPAFGFVVDFRLPRTDFHS
jgi:hypothetical protein